MKILVLSVDRDNDFGRKAGIQSPIIGREENIKAAVALGTKDPEDSDSNAVLAAVSAYDELKSMEKDVEIATICGDLNVGVFSDHVLAEQLERVIQSTGATNAVLVTDGSEDECIVPIIQSRLKIDSVKKITMKQTQTVQDTYYIIKRMLEDEKIQRKFVIPIALVFLVWGIAALLGHPDMGLGGIVLVIAIYLLEKSLHISESMKKLSGERITFAVLFVAIGLIVVGTITTYMHMMDVQRIQGYSLTRLQLIFIPVADMTWWVIGAYLTLIAGRIVDSMIEGKSIWIYASTPFTALMFGLIVPSVANMVLPLIEARPLTNLPYQFFWIITGIGFGITGNIVRKWAAQKT